MTARRFTLAPSGLSLSDFGSVLLPGPPAGFGQLIADETEKWGKVIRFAGLKAQ